MVWWSGGRDVVTGASKLAGKVGYEGGLDKGEGG